jgi:transcriptional regulator with XRE-family HTH domain
MTKAEAVTSIRLALGITKTQFARQLNVALQSIYRYESGKSCPTQSLIPRLIELARSYELHDAAEAFTRYVPKPSQFPENVTLRDQLAMAALTGYIAQPIAQYGFSTSDQFMADRCYTLADAMLAQRKKAGA